MIPGSWRSYLDEPAVLNPPARVWRDWVLVGAVVIASVLEAALRTDDPWTNLPLGWQIASFVSCLVVVPLALLVRRSAPLFATVYGFGVTIAFGFVVAVIEGEFGGLTTTAVLLIIPYALFRWGSGRHGAIGGGILIAAGIVGNLVDPGTIGDVIGGFVVLVLPVLIGLMVRYRSSARERAVADARSRERETIARELHDTVAHHVSAIAVQAQAGRAMASTKPEAALDVLAVIEEAASRTLEEMRSMVGTLRNDEEAQLAPQHGIRDIPKLADNFGRLSIDVDLSGSFVDVPQRVDAAVYRIAQESVTNAARHARRATRVDVTVVGGSDSISLVVRNDGDPVVHDHGGHTELVGFGLVGMSERATLLGGTLHAGPLPSGGWRVCAELPRNGGPR